MKKPLKIILFISFLLAFISTISYCSAPFDTETAKMISIRKTVNGQGYILRNESVVQQSSNGLFEASVKDGTRVSGGKSVGVAISGNYSDELVSKLEDVTKRIEDIKKSGNFADIYASDEARIFSALKDITGEIRRNVQEENYTLAAQNTYQLKTLLEKKYSSENSGAAQELLSQLEAEKKSLENQLGGIRESVIAPASGFFYTTLDGLEGKQNEKELFAITPSKVSKLSDKLKKYERPNNHAGKIVDTYSWYLTAIIPVEEAELLKKGSSVTLSIDETTPVKATVEALNTDDIGNCAVVVKSTRDARNIYEKRVVDFEICYEEYTGLYVPSAAIRVRDGVTGVYVINRNEVVSFRAVDILLQEEEYYIVRNGYNPPEGTPYSSLKLYDDILVNPEVVRNNELGE